MSTLTGGMARSFPEAVLESGPGGEAAGGAYCSTFCRRWEYRFSAPLRRQGEGKRKFGEVHKISGQNLSKR